ncbi:GntR family transcriptional regulator [Herbaspirillum sp. LeCh32-8]|uniref:GntR family transcriptional regulator n=1 Tax=Herbaspirillum sp. LeCh32-8 TaxID=2821356 RepID=UPI001AE4BB01|nr:GntR family transcriptional regulator [Herbaspirillum sp. LeCh32-8]MBP0597779.1 GntR family transcriptional regulator [Herbaspirillum sp. LeCh32-8]
MSTITTEPAPSGLVPLTLDRSRHAAPQVFEHLREQIVTVRIAPGTVLQRADLAAQYGLSQTPIRDALIKLGEEGLVDIFPQHATVVSAVNVSMARQAHFLRRSIELEIVHTLAQAPSPVLVTRLRDSIELQKVLAERENYAEFVLADQAFHRYMYEAAQVPELWTMVRRQSGSLDRLRNLHIPIPGKTRRVIADHIAIVDAIAAGDSDAAQAALREHLSGTLSHLDDIRQRFPNYLKE